MEEILYTALDYYKGIEFSDFYNSSMRAVAIGLFLSLFLSNLLSYLAIKKYHFKRKFSQSKKLALMNHAPGISIITGAYNESMTIIDNVHSLLSLNYHKFELVVVNDGSSDDTLDKLIKEFKLEETKYIFETIVQSSPIRGIYRSTDMAYKNLVVIDKFNGGGKADAINAGLNIAKYDYFLNIDVDCVLDFDTLLIMMDVVLNEKKRCIGVGATLRMSNSSFVNRGTMENVGVPKKLLVRFQELEYIRSFVLGKMAWSYLNAVPNISGGLGLFDKEIVLKIGGYDKNSLGEDMDLVFRMVGYMQETNQPYCVRSVPRTLCWTEGPETLQILVRQRIRWARGLFQILKKNKKVFLNPKYGRMGFIIFPYNLFFEFLSPFVEFIGIFVLIYSYFYDPVAFMNILYFIIAVISFYIGLSFSAVFLDRKVFNYYNNGFVTLGISAMAILEPFMYHPIIVYCSLKGYYDELTGKKKKWGVMTRKGFNKTN